MALQMTIFKANFWNSYPYFFIMDLEGRSILRLNMYCILYENALISLRPASLLRDTLNFELLDQLVLDMEHHKEEFRG